MRLFDLYMKDFGRQWVSRVMQFYNVPKIKRVTGRDDSQKYFKFYVEDKPEVAQQIGQDGIPVQVQVGTRKVAHVRQFVQSETGELVPGGDKEFVVRGDFDVHVSSASGLPFNKAERKQESLDLFDRQIIDAEEVLKNIDYPNRDSVLQRVKQQQAEAAQMVAAGQA